MLPDGDKIAGRVTEVVGTDIHLENPHGTFTLLTDADTVFRLGRHEEGSLDDVTPGRKVVAFGEKLDDTTYAVDLVIIGPAVDHRPPEQP